MNWKLSTTVSDFNCSNFIMVSNYLMKNAKKGDMVILSSRDSFYFSDVVPISNELRKISMTVLLNISMNQVI